MTTSTTRPDGRELTVGQVAAEYGITVRTLHHYDAVGLLSPSLRGGNGYRLYTESDLERLQHVVVYRRLDFSLEEIAEILDGDPASTVEHLRRQRDAVMSRLGELEGLVRAIDNALEAEMNEYRISKDEQRELFGGSFDDPYAEEAEARWGHTPQWEESQRRAKAYSKEDWARIKAENDQVVSAFAAAHDAGLPAGSAEAMDAAEEHHTQIERSFYTCPYAMHRGLGDMYVADPRFAQTFESVRPGLAQYVRDAIHANADRHEDRP